MISAVLLKKHFLQAANKTAYLKKIVRSKGEFNSKPKIEFSEPIELKNCIVKRKRPNYNYSETGVSTSESITLVRLFDESIVFAIGDKIVFDNVEYSIESPPYFRDRILDFTTIVLELSHVGIKN